MGPHSNSLWNDVAGKLYPYPVHHYRDKSAQVDLSDTSEEHKAAFPRFADARGFE